MLGRAGAWATAIQNAVATAEGGKYVRTTRFISIAAGTSGTIALPSNAEVVLDDFGGTVDAVVLQISGGKPVALPALTSTGAVVATTFTTGGVWAFSGTPVSYPVAIVYRVQTQLAAFDSTSSDIWGDSETIGVAPIASGGTGLSSFSIGDFLYASAANILSALAGNSTGTKKFLSMISSVPSWGTLAFTDLTGTATAAQLPNPSASTLGGVESLAVVSHNFLTGISTSGVPTQAQPAFTDISGSVAAAQLPNPSASTLGGVESLAVVSHNFLTGISTLGVPTQAQPAFTDISGSATVAQLPADIPLGAVGITIDGGGVAITTGLKGYISIPFNCTIVSATITADVAGAIVIDVWKDTYANFPPVVGDKITASAPPTIAATNQSSTDSTLTGWGVGKTITAGDVLAFNVNSCTTITKATLVLKVTK